MSNSLDYTRTTERKMGFFETMIADSDFRFGLTICTVLLSLGLGVSMIIYFAGIATTMYSNSIKWEDIEQGDGTVCIAIERDDGPELLCPIE